MYCGTQGPSFRLYPTVFLRKNLSSVVVKDISELLNIKLNLIAANSSEMPYIGWVELNFRLLPYKNDLKVPLLFTE